MTDRRMRGASLGLAGALAAGLLLAPSGGGAAAGEAGPAGPTDPVFHEVSAQVIDQAAGDARVASRSSVHRATSPASAARAAMSKGTQILQTATGLEGVGSGGVSLATGPKQVVQVAGPRIRALTKTTLASPKGGQKTLLKFFSLGGSVLVTQPAVVYDPVGKRFIVVAVADYSGDIGLVMRISKGTAATPLTKKKWLKPVEFASNASVFEEPGRADVDESHPSIGVTSDKIVVTAPSVDPSDATVANRIFLFPKSAYYNGNEPGGWAASVNDTFDGQAPAVNATKQSNAFVAIPDTGDVTVTTYAGKANILTAPKYSKNVMFPSKSLVAPPLVSQSGGDDLDVGDLAFTGVSWRKNKLYAATTVNSGGRAAVRVFGIRTSSGVSLTSDKTLKSSTANWFNPDLASDRAGNILLTANDVGTEDGPSLAVFSRKAKGGTWLAPIFIARSTSAVNLPGDPIDWLNTTGAALDPTSPWDVWVTGTVGAASVTDNLSTKIGRISLAKNKAKIKASSTEVQKGKKVTFTLKLVRPDSKDTIKGLPIALQKAPKSGGSWSTIKKGKTSAKGSKSFKLTINKAAKYRTLGKGVKQKNGAGRVFAKVKSQAITVNLK